jgi:CRP-like cAMP-binding protein
VILLLSGWDCRYKVLADGSKQIVAYLVPGDLCDPHVFILKAMDHSIGLRTDATLAFNSREAIISVTDRCPKIARALWWSTLVDEAVLRHWLVNLGQRDAFDRVAHLFCELWDRMRQVGLREGEALEVPLTQEQLGDTMALTTVHTNRVIQRMRAEGLISVTRKMIRVHDVARLRALCGYDPTYLHLRRRK